MAIITQRLRKVTAVAIVLAIAGPVLALATFALLQPSGARAEAEEYAVYSAYIRNGLTGRSHSLGSPRGTILILSHTTMSDTVEPKDWRAEFGAVVIARRDLRESFRGLSRWAVYDFILKNLFRKELSNHFDIPAHSVLLPAIGLEDARVFPDSYGHLTFSRIGFNRNLTEAVFYTEHLCGLCGAGQYVYMRKINGRWTVPLTRGTWVS